MKPQTVPRQQGQQHITQHLEQPGKVLADKLSGFDGIIARHSPV